MVVTAAEGHRPPNASLAAGGSCRAFTREPGVTRLLRLLFPRRSSRRFVRGAPETASEFASATCRHQVLSDETLVPGMRPHDV